MLTSPTCATITLLLYTVGPSDARVALDARHHTTTTSSSSIATYDNTQPGPPYYITSGSRVYTSSGYDTTSTPHIVTDPPWTSSYTDITTTSGSTSHVPTSPTNTTSTPSPTVTTTTTTTTNAAGKGAMWSTMGALGVAGLVAVLVG